MTDINKLKEIEKLINVKFRKSSFTDYSYDYGEFVTSSFEGAPFQYWSWAAEPTYKYSVNDQGNIIGLCITRHGITEILEPILELKNIEYLNLSYNYIKDISLLVHFHKLKELVLFNNPIINYHKLIYHRLPKPLIVLLVETKRKINFNKIHFDDLSNKINCYSVNGLNELTGLRISEVGSLPVIRLLPYYKYLKHLALLNGEIKNIEPIQVISELQYLNLNNNKITDIQSIKGLKALRYLNLGNNQISNIDPISKLINLEYLVINNNSIENVNQLGHLSRLRVLICKNNRLKSFKSFYSLFKNEDFYIDAKPNPLEEPPLDILTQGNLAVLDWLDSVKAIANEVKLIFAGNTTTGKTSLAKFLVNSEYESLTDSTHGINISKWIINDLNINIWDLGGQEYYHSTHRLFMSDNAVYVIVWEKKSNFSGILKTQIKISGVNKKTLKNLHHFDYLFWIHLIKEKYASNSPVFLVQNKIELEDNEEVSVREGLLNKYETIFDHAISIAKAHEYIKSNKPKDRQFFLKYEIFKEELVKTLQLVSQKKQIQQYIINIRNEVINISKSNNYISYTVFSELCEAILKENYNSEKTKIAIQYLHEAGIILYYGFVEHNYNFLDDIVFLNPTFVSKTIYKILDIRVQSNWGKFNYNHVLSVLK
ncbi:MAG: leucine-rich repeat domain-containing protein, partial [Bacteroidetes bacterium]|nr:leucine-rich repeat domain-containing protein [Bacteroidota bacterium]